MEHYDGPAFYRKFPVKPTPVKQQEAPLTERAASQVKHRQRRNQPQNREIPVTPTVSTGTRQERQTETEHQHSTSPDSLDYRPFQVTKVPKQLHWSHQDDDLQKRYQRLVTRLQRPDDSFLLFAAPNDQLAGKPFVSDAPLTAPTATADDATTTLPQVPVSRATVTIHPRTQNQMGRPTVTIQPTVSTPVAAVADTTEKKTPLTETISPLMKHPETPEKGPVATVPVDPAPTEIFYPEEVGKIGQITDVATSETTTPPVSDAASDDAMVTPTDEGPDEDLAADDLETTADDQETAADVSEPSDELDNQEDPTAENQSLAPASQSTPVSTPMVDYLPVGSTSTPTPATGGGESVETATAASEALSGADSQTTVTETSGQDSDVERLLARATDAPDESAAAPMATVTDESDATSDASMTRDDRTKDLDTKKDAPVSDDDEMTVETTTDEATDEPSEPVASAAPVTPPVHEKPKAKPTRGLGHSLGDIMQEEGNEQRNLALFAGPTTHEAVPVATESSRGYHFPNLTLLPKPVVPDEKALDEWIEHQATVLDATLSAFHVDANVTDWTVGPTVTQFQVKLALGVKVNKITNLNDDLKLALAAKDIRIEAPIPGKTTVGIEIPNKKSRPVMLSEILNSEVFKKSESPLTVALGVDLFGQPQVTDLRKMPHGLIAGATGSGKSVFINSLLLSILYKATPQQVKLLLIDPKAVEMAPYDGLPHLLAPVISDPKAAAAALKWVVTEMDQRYEKLAAAGVRNIEQFNDRADANDEPALKMPYIVIIIDELADLMMMAASEVQDYIVRITQKARAAGIHLLVATQRPSVDIVTGTIKNNIPTRIAFMVSSQIDSRTILDTSGAESLLGRGDMLYLGNGASQPMRLQGAYVEAEVDAVTDFVRTQGQPRYAFEPNGLLKQETDAENQDELLPKVLEYIAQEKSVSTSKLQRVFSIGYNRAANLIDDLEQHNYVSPQHGSKPREVYLTPDDLGKDLPEPHDQDAPFSS